MRIKRLCAVFLAASLFLLSQAGLACSNIAINGGGFAVVARTMDFPFNTGNTFGIGFKGEKNTSDLNMTNNPAAKPATWTNRHNFIGQSWINGPALVDGMNDAGVSAAFLYLPDFTVYPEFNPKDKRPVFNVTEALNYVLANADSAADAIVRLKKLQMVNGAMPMIIKGHPGLFLTAPGHLIIRDKTGDASLVEFLDGKPVFYEHVGPVITNAPPYDWQVKNAQRYDYVQSEHNINAQFDGAFMNGSGFIGLPGDWTPPSRFARATQVIKHMQTPQNDAMALRLALDAIETVQVPMGSNDSPTFWKTVSDLKNNVYYYYPMFKLTPEYATLNTPGVKISCATMERAWVTQDLKKLAKANGKVPKGMVHSILKTSPKSSIKKIFNWTRIPTAGPKTQTENTQRKTDETKVSHNRRHYRHGFHRG